MLIVAIHEFSHAATGCCTGAKIKSISLDPREGGVTMMAGGIAAITLPAGYLGSVRLYFTLRVQPPRLRKKKKQQRLTIEFISPCCCSLCSELCSSFAASTSRLPRSPPSSSACVSSLLCK